MSLRTIQIRFLRKNSTPQDDDRVTIKRVGVDLYTLTYKDSTLKNTPTWAILDSRGIFRWLRILLRVVKKDSDPFDSVQFDLPTMPSFLISTDSIDDSYHTILDAVEFHLDRYMTQFESVPPPGGEPAY